MAPLNFISDTTLELPYYDSVKIDASSGIISEYIPDTTRYKLVNKNSGKVLDVLDGSVDNAAQIVQWTDNGS